LRCIIGARNNSEIFVPRYCTSTVEYIPVVEVGCEREAATCHQEPSSRTAETQRRYENSLRHSAEGQSLLLLPSVRKQEGKIMGLIDRSHSPTGGARGCDSRTELLLSLTWLY